MITYISEYNCSIYYSTIGRPIGFNIMQDVTIGFICYCLDIPISCHISKYDLR